MVEKNEDNNTEEDDVKQMGMMARMLGVDSEAINQIFTIYLPMVQAMAETISLNFDMITSLKREVEECKQIMIEIQNKLK